MQTERDGYTLSFGRCEGWQDEWVDAADDADADVALVVLGAWDVFDFELDDGTDLEFGTPEWDDYVTENLQSGIDALAAAGTRVALLEVPCMRPQDVEGSGVPALPERGDDDRVAHLNDLWRDVAAANAGTVTFVEGPDGVVRRRGREQRHGVPLGRCPRLHPRRQPHLHHDRPDPAHPLTIRVFRADGVFARTVAARHSRQHEHSDEGRS